MPITWEQFTAVEMRCGKIVGAQRNVKARKPAYALEIDFGAALGVKRSSAQLTANYSAEGLVGQHVVAVMNLAPRNVAGVVSEVLVLATVDGSGDVRLLQADAKAPLGALVA